MPQLKTADILPVKAALLKTLTQCPLCTKTFAALAPKDIVLDHDHRTGLIRGLLCRNCNGLEGQIFNRATRGKKNLTEIAWLENMVAYLKSHTPPKTKWMHPTHKTTEQKRVRTNKLARQRRKKAKKK